MADPAKTTGMSREIKAGLLATGAFGCLVAGVMVKKHLAPEELLGHKPTTEQVAYEFPDKPDSENHEKDVKAAEPPAPETPMGLSGVMLASAQESGKDNQGKAKDMVLPLTGSNSALPALPPLPGAGTPPPPAPVPLPSNPPSLNSPGLPPLPPLPGAKNDAPLPSFPAPGGSAFPPLPGSSSASPPPPLPVPAMPPKRAADEPSGLPPLPSLPGATSPAPSPASAFPPPTQPKIDASPAPINPPPPPAMVPETRPMAPAAVTAFPGSTPLPSFSPPPPSAPAAPAFNAPAAPAFNAPGVAMPVEARVITFPSGQGPARRTEFIPAPESATPTPFPAPPASPPPSSFPAPLPPSSAPPSGAPSAPPGPAPAFSLGNSTPPPGLPTLTMPAAGGNRPVFTPAPISNDVVNRSIPVLTMPGSPSAQPPTPAVASTFTVPAALAPTPNGPSPITPVTAMDRPVSSGVITPSGITFTPSAPPGAPLAIAPVRPKVATWSENVHVARPGDTYPAIAEQYYRDPKMASALFIYNRNHPRAREDAPKDGSLLPGMDVYLPDRAALNPPATGAPALPSGRTGP